MPYVVQTLVTSIKLSWTSPCLVPKASLERGTVNAQRTIRTVESFPPLKLNAISSGLQGVSGHKQTEEPWG